VHLSQHFVGGHAGMCVLAGSGVGGGTRVNWCASFRTPQHVRKEWAEEHGLGFMVTDAFTDALDVVCARLNVHSEPSVDRDVSASDFVNGLRVCDIVLNTLQLLPWRNPFRLCNRVAMIDACVRRSIVPPSKQPHFEVLQWRCHPLVGAEFGEWNRRQYHLMKRVDPNFVDLQRCGCQQMCHRLEPV
jgi:hypothetical protein